MIMKHYMNITRNYDRPLTSDDLTNYSKEGWDLVTVKPDWSRQRTIASVGYGSSSPIPTFETWIFSKEV